MGLIVINEYHIRSTLNLPKNDQGGIKILQIANFDFGYHQDVLRKSGGTRGISRPRLYVVMNIMLDLPSITPTMRKVV